MELTVKKEFSLLHVSVNNSDEVVEVAVTIVARFPGFIERIPCSVVINKGINSQLITDKIICHIYIGICVIHEGQHLPHDIIPRLLHFGRECEDWSCHELRSFDCSTIHDFEVCAHFV